jgi:hypothetical protein
MNDTVIRRFAAQRTLYLARVRLDRLLVGNPQLQFEVHRSNVHWCALGYTEA